MIRGTVRNHLLSQIRGIITLFKVRVFPSHTPISMAHTGDHNDPLVDASENLRHDGLNKHKVPEIVGGKLKLESVSGELKGCVHLRDRVN